MASVYNYSYYRARFLLESFSDSASCVMSDISVLKNKYRELDNAVDDTRTMLLDFFYKVKKSNHKIENTLDLVQSCSNALEMDSIDEMIAVRNEIKKKFHR